MARSIEWLTEAATITNLGLVPALAPYSKNHAEDHEESEEFAGIAVSAQNQGTVSQSADGDVSRQIERMSVTVSARRIIPNADVTAVDGIRRSISDAVYNPQLPAGFSDWNEWALTAPSFQDLSFFSVVQGSLTTGRDDSGDRGVITIKFEAYVARKN